MTMQTSVRTDKGETVTTEYIGGDQPESHIEPASIWGALSRGATVTIRMIED